MRSSAGLERGLAQSKGVAYFGYVWDFGRMLPRVLADRDS
jgi:hypothetical protein